MGFFSDMLQKLGFGREQTAAAAAAPEAPASAPPAVKPVAVVDVVGQLDALAARRSEKLNWRTSIVDLLKLLGLDSSFAGRRVLAAEVGITGYSGEAAQNIALHKLVLQKLADNGGNVPAELLR